MSQIVQTAKNVFSIPSLKAKPEQERTASVFGMVESGKTTVLTLLEIVCIDYACKSNQKGSKTRFHSLIEEYTSGICQAGSEMRQGMFPEKTPQDKIFEAVFRMRFDETLGKRQIRLPWCETGGETFSKLLERFQNAQYDITAEMEDSVLIKDYILDTDAIICIAPVTRGAGLETDIGAKLHLPDVNLRRLLAGIYKYKELDSRSNPNHRPIKGIAVFLTKYDALQDFLEAKQMNLNTKEGVHAFMSKYFPETYAVLGWYGLENVRFWATGVAIETEKNEFNKVVAKLHPLNPARGYKIKVDHNRNVPIFTEAPFYEFIEWLKDTVMA